MIYITGDIHGRPDILDEILKILKPGDILIVVGDFGVGFFDSYCSEEKFYDYIAKMQITLIFIDGNHEVFPKLNGYAVSEWNGGKVHKIRDNIIHCMRGEVYTIEGNSSNRCKRNTYSRGSVFILGYGCPNYSGT